MFACEMGGLLTNRTWQQVRFEQSLSGTHSRTQRGISYLNRDGEAGAWIKLRLPSRTFGGATSRHRTLERSTPTSISTVSRLMWTRCFTSWEHSLSHLSPL